MKVKILLAIALVFSFFKSNAQTASTDADEKAFKKGSFVIMLGAGMGGYKTFSEHTYDYDSAYWDGSAVQTVSVTATRKDDNGAVSVIAPLTLEYGVTNWLGLGIRGGYCKYLGKDSNTNVTPKVYSIDLDGLVNFHFVKSKHFDMPLSINVGYSIFNYQALDALESTAKDHGINFGVGINPRIYFGDHFGMHFDLKYASYIYPSLSFSNSNDPSINDLNNDKFSLKGKGINFGLGFQYRF